jgi:exonuclease III
MKFLSFNCKGVVSPSKKFALHRMVESTQPDLILPQETMGEASLVTFLLEVVLKQWNFIDVDSKGRSGGLAMGWNTRTIKILNSRGFDSGIGINISMEDMGRCFTVLNVYGPTQDHIPFWENLLNKSFLKNEDLILVGILNYSLGMAESWGQRAHPNSLSDFFNHIMGDKGLIY